MRVNVTTFAKSCLPQEQVAKTATGMMLAWGCLVGCAKVTTSYAGLGAVDEAGHAGAVTSPSGNGGTTNVTASGGTVNGSGGQTSIGTSSGGTTSASGGATASTTGGVSSSLGGSLTGGSKATGGVITGGAASVGGATNANGGSGNGTGGAGVSTAGASSGCPIGVAFCDDFEDGDANGWSVSGLTWAVVTDASSSRVYSGGNGSAHAYANATAALADQTVQADMKVVSMSSGSSYRAGVLARRQDNANFFMIAVDGAGNLVLLKSSSSTLSSASGTCDSVAAPSGFDPKRFNTYKIVVKGAPPSVAVKTYLNGTMLHDCVTTNTSATANGSAGVLTYGSGTTAMFDNVIVTSP